MNLFKIMTPPKTQHLHIFFFFFFQIALVTLASIVQLWSNLVIPKFVSWRHNEFHSSEQVKAAFIEPKFPPIVQLPINNQNMQRTLLPTPTLSRQFIPIFIVLSLSLTHILVSGCD